MDNYSESLLSVDVCRASDQPFEGMFSLFEAAFSNQVPGRLRGEQENWEQEGGPHPLESLCKRVSICYPSKWRERTNGMR